MTHQTPTPEQLEELEAKVADTLAYYQCRETNPKADHPRMGYHAFSEEQREHLRAQKAEAAAEIVRMMLALAAPAPAEPSEDDREACVCGHERDAHVYGVCGIGACVCKLFKPAEPSDARVAGATVSTGGDCAVEFTSGSVSESHRLGCGHNRVFDRALAERDAHEVDEAKLAEVIWSEQESRVLNGYVIHTPETARTTAAAVAEWLRGAR